jgi:HK97 family phage major capsid protein
MNLTELRAKRDAYMNTMRGIVNSATSENRGLTASEQKDWDGLKEKVGSLNGTLDRASQLGELRSEIEKPIVSGPVQHTEGGMSYVSRGMNPGEVRTYRPNEAIAEGPYQGPGLGAYVRGIVTGKWNGAEELRALAEGSTPGSYLVPTPLALRCIDLMRNRTRVIEAGAVTVPMESNTLKIARQTGDVTAGWKSENAAINFSDAAFDSVQLSAQLLAAGSKLSVEIVEDAYNIDQIVTESIIKALALELDRVALYGTGTAPQPKGIKNQTGVTLTTLGSGAGKTLTNYSDFSPAIATILGYNFAGPFGAIYSPRTAGRLDALVDTLGQPMRQPDSVAAMKKYPTNQVPNNLTVGTATTCSDAFIGDFSECLIGMRTNLLLEISRVAADATGSAFANAQIWLRAYTRCDIALAHPLAFNVLSGIL